MQRVCESLQQVQQAQLAVIRSDVCACACVCVCVCVMCPQAMEAVTRALQDSSMGLNPEVEGTIIRVPVPKWVLPPRAWIPITTLTFPFNSTFYKLCLLSLQFLSFCLILILFACSMLMSL